MPQRQTSTTLLPQVSAPQEQMVQGDIALHSADVAIGEKDPTYGGYGATGGKPHSGQYYADLRR